MHSKQVIRCEIMLRVSPASSKLTLDFFSNNCPNTIGIGIPLVFSVQEPGISAFSELIQNILSDTVNLALHVSV